MRNKKTDEREGDRSASLRDALRSRGMRLTKPRTRIAELLDKKMLTIKELLKTRKSIEQSTVYRILDEFESHGLIHRIALSGGVVRYEMSTRHHDHLECIVCGLVAHIPCEFGRTVRTPKIKSWRVIDHEILWKGMCGHCSETS